MFSGERNVAKCMPVSHILEHYPVIWNGLLILQHNQASIQVHYISGNPNIARASLPRIQDGVMSPLRISQKLQFDQTELDGVFRQIELMEDHCILMALSSGNNLLEVMLECNNLELGFINHLMSQHVAGVASAAAPPGSEEPLGFEILIFPLYECIKSNLYRIAPALRQLNHVISRLVFIVVPRGTAENLILGKCVSVAYERRVAQA